MKQLFNIVRFILVFVLFLKGIQLYGQNDFRFSYVCGNEIKRPFTSKILLKYPDNTTSNLLIDTVSKYNFSEINYLKFKGKYTLSIWFETDNYGKDSLEYDFNLNGNEIISDISVSFDFSERLIKKGDIFIKGKKVINGYIRLNKYYSAPKSIDILLDNENLGDEYYKGPFFKIKNNSSDTLYGEHLPGYFLGTLSYIRNDSTLFTSIGNIDYEFGDSPPLYPDSTKYATVGSFGLSRTLTPFEYRFEVLLAKKWQSQGIGVYKERQNIDWWAGTKEYYKLTYDFKVNE
jgi:hypothetical protein